MLLPQPLTRGRLIRRYKRFLADVAFDGHGEETVHTPNPGAMLGLSTPGMTVWTSLAASRTRKLPRTWELVDSGGTLVGVNTLLANRLVAEALTIDLFPELTGYAAVQREVRYGETSRVDFRLLADDGPSAWLEVKSVTLSRVAGRAEWPDCTSTRAAAHMRELSVKAGQGERAVALFVVQRGDCDRLSIASDLDPAFAAEVERARGAGVEVLCYGCDVSIERIAIARRLAFLG